MTTTKNEQLKAKVISKLIQWGNNKNEVEKMVKIHFEQASRLYSTVKTISECIRTIY